MPDLTPITREEMFLDGNTELTPITREEKILAGEDIDVITRREWFLKKYRGGGGGGGYQIKDIPNTPCDIATFTDGSNLPMPNLKVSIEPIQSGSGDPSPSNVRPISGWSGANVYDTGKNFYNPSFTRESGYYDDNGVLQTSSTTGHTQLTPINSNTEYYFSIHARSNGGGKFAVYFWDANRNWISRVSKDYSSNFDDNNITFTTPNNCRFISFQVPIGTSVTSLEFDDSLTMICLNLLGTDFEPYNGQTYNIPFTDSQGNPITVYGGECDVVNGGGSAYKEYDSYNGETLIGPWISDRDVYAPNTSPTIGAQVVDMGDTSTFTSQPTSIKSLEGSNNVWGDCGQITEGSYFSESEEE